MIDPKRSRAFFAGEMVVLAGFIGESLLAYERPSFSPSAAEHTADILDRVVATALVPDGETERRIYERLRELAGLARAMLTAADEGAREADRREAHEVLSIILMEVTRLAGE